ncbi:hypothetical protein MTO96_027571 [Rhipicephalus appendiculatus]
MDSTDRPAAQKSVDLPAPPQTPTDLSGCLEVTGPARPPQRSDKEQGPCLASSRQSSCSPACPAEKEERPRLASPAGPSSEPGTGLWNYSRERLCLWSSGRCTRYRLLQKRPTAMARGLLTAVFSRHALLTCSMKGQKAKGLHKPMAPRPPLRAAGPDAILGNV